jgi:hypothetical protein
MSDQGPFVERILERTARAISGGGLHPLEVLSEVEGVVLASRSEGVVANDVTIAFHPADYRRYEVALGALRREVEALLDQVEQREGLRRIGERRLAFASDDRVGRGDVRVVARFVETEHRPTAPLPPGATRRILRLRGAWLVTADGLRVRLTHTPFTLGRGPGNDAVLPSLAVSRHHATIVETSEGLRIEDAGSRNGLVVDGQRARAALLDHGEHVTVGDVELWVEWEA